jgi:hypothetical protein
MPTRERKQRLKLPANAPRYAERELRLILRFIASLTLDTIYAIKGQTEFSGGKDVQDYHKRCMLYWTNRLEFLRHVAIRATHKQRHLVELSEEEFTEIVKIWNLPSKTLLSLEQSGISVTTRPQSAGNL